jgi:hypothetical protein
MMCCLHLQLINKYFEPPGVWASHAMFYDPRFKGLLNLRGQEPDGIRAAVKEEVRTLQPPGHSGNRVCL